MWYFAFKRAPTCLGLSYNSTTYGKVEAKQETQGREDSMFAHRCPVYISFVKF